MRRATPRGRYRVEFKVRALAALDANEGKIYTTARLLGISKTTLRDWNQQRDAIHRELERQEKQRSLMLEDRLEAMIDQIANGLMEKIDSMKPLESIQALKLMLGLREMIAKKPEAQDHLPTRTEVHEKLLRLLDQAAGENEEMAEEWAVNRSAMLPNS